MSREDGIYDLRHYGIIEADDAGKQRFAPLQLADQVLTKFVFDAAAGQRRFKVFIRAKGAECFRKARRGFHYRFILVDRHFCLLPVALTIH